MSNNSNAVTIGAFVVGAMLILIITLIFITGSGFSGDRQKVVMVFDGSVKGLSLGAPLALRGVQIGQVTDIKLMLDTSTVDLIMLVEGEIQPGSVKYTGDPSQGLIDELIARGLRAQLNTQSLLTGLLYVQLDFHPSTKVTLRAIDSPHIQIPTIPTDLERITRQLDSVDFAKMATELQSIATGLNDFVSNENFQSLPGQMQEVLASLKELSVQLSAQLGSTGARLDTVLAEAAISVRTVNTELPQLSTSAQLTLTKLNSAISSFDDAMIEFEQLVASDSPTTYQLGEALKELALASRALRSLANTLEEQPEALIKGKKVKLQ